MSWWNRRSVLRVLSDCVLRREGSFVMFPELATFYPAKFASLQRKHFELELLPQRDAGIQTACMSCVTFRYKFKPYFFVSAVSEYRENSSPRLPTLVLELPERLFTDGRRAAFRVPVVSGSGLITRVTSASGRVWTPAVDNLSVSGVLLTFPAEETPDLPPDAVLDIALMLDANVASLRAQVRRRTHCSYGLEFLNVFDASGLNPPTGLRNILRSLERKWFNEQFRRSAELFREPDNEVPSACSARASHLLPSS